MEVILYISLQSFFPLHAPEIYSFTVQSFPEISWNVKYLMLMTISNLITKLDIKTSFFHLKIVHTISRNDKVKTFA